MGSNNIIYHFIICADLYTCEISRNSFASKICTKILFYMCVSTAQTSAFNIIRYNSSHQEISYYIMCIFFFFFSISQTGGDKQFSFQCNCAGCESAIQSSKFLINSSFSYSIIINRYNITFNQSKRLRYLGIVNKSYFTDLLLN